LSAPVLAATWVICSTRLPLRLRRVVWLVKVVVVYPRRARQLFTPASRTPSSTFRVMVGSVIAKT
jgi:hypothetical protein